MKALMRAAIGTVSVYAAAGCMIDREPPSEEARVELQVGPLLLSGVSSVCYDVEVSTAGDTVWTRGDPNNTRGGRSQANRELIGTVDAETVCSDEFGNGGGGDIAYVGPCDASPSADTLPDAAHPGVQNDVTIFVDGLYDAGRVDLGQWRDPCAQGCTLSFTCLENQDTLAELNLTIMREADQGFFDIAVNFADIFCSAKLDNCYDGDRHIELLHGADDVRDWTAVFGFACSAGSDATETNLLYGLVAVDCGSAGTFTLDPTADAGNAHVSAGTNTLHYGVYRGLEQLDCGSGPASCKKAYWNLAISMTDLLSFGGETCTLSFSATANDDNEGFASGLPTARGLVYPYIDVDATLTTSGSASCQRHGLDVGTSAVRTAYKGDVLGVPPPVMCSQYDGVVSTVGVCDGSCGVCSCVASMTIEGDRLSANFASSGAAPVWQMGDGTQYEAVSVDHTYTTPGVYHVTATFADGRLATDFGAVNQEDLTALSFSPGCTHVVSVSVPGTALSELDLRMLPALRVASAAYNTSLATLLLSGNPLTGLDVTGAPLTSLQLVSSPLDCEDVVGLSAPEVCVDD